MLLGMHPHNCGVRGCRSLGSDRGSAGLGVPKTTCLVQWHIPHRDRSPQIQSGEEGGTAGSASTGGDAAGWGGRQGRLGQQGQQWQQG